MSGSEEEAILITSSSEEVVVEDHIQNIDVCDSSAEAIKKTPSLIFVVPYRDRQQHHAFFSTHMKKILEDYEPGSYEIVYVHQKDKRTFNRGAMKNIGFIYIKNKYPLEYHNMTFVFNDIDTMPYTKGFLDYQTVIGVVKHFYGFRFALGGIVSICGKDFERINGFPNYWGWGYEDNAIQKRVIEANLKIDRSQFYLTFDKNILQLKDGITRIVNRGEFQRFVNEMQYNTSNEGISNITALRFDGEIGTDGFLHVTYFKTGVEENSTGNTVYDMRTGPRPFPQKTQLGRSPAGRFSMGFF